MLCHKTQNAVFFMLMQVIGYRAMLTTIGSLVAARDSGLLDCVTYTAGVSGNSIVCASTLLSIFESFPAGSCWALGTLYSGVSGSFQPVDVASHLLDRITTSYLDTETLDALITSPTNKVRIVISDFICRANNVFCLHYSFVIVSIYWSVHAEPLL